MDSTDDGLRLHLNRPAPFLHNRPSNLLGTPKKRSLSDSTPSLDPSPKFREPPQKARDDEVLIATPTRAPRRVDLSARGLYLQMPAKESYPSTPAAATGLGIQTAQLDQRESYGSPSSVLPRHSRGIDFARAATNLHHSTLAEQQTPDSSPTITHRHMPPPSRRGSTYAMAIDSPRVGSISGWSWSSAGSGEKSLSRSVGSTAAMISEGSSSSSEDDNDTLMGQDEAEDGLLSTPQIHRRDDGSVVTPYESRMMDGMAGSNSQSPVPGSFANYRRSIFGKRHVKNHRDHPYQRNRTSSPEASSMTATTHHGGNLFGQDSGLRSPRSRRESLSLGIGSVLHITSSNEEFEDSPLSIGPTTPGVVKRPVTRRSNLLPKTKNFARIRAALQEENSPIDTDVRRESEVVRQVRVNDVGLKNGVVGTTPSSPDIAPIVRNMSNEGSEMSDMEASGVKGGLGSGYLADLRRSSSGRDFWRPPQNRSQTPPPPPPAFLNRHRSSSGVSEDMSIGSPGVSTPPPVSLTSTQMMEALPSVVSIEPAFSAPLQPSNLPSAAEITRKINKRRRDEDFDINSFKRRAVSPGMSVQSSPVLGQSPISNAGCFPNRPSREGSTPGASGEDKPPSSGNMGGQATPNLGPKRVGLQGMTDTSDGLMNMTIE